MEETPQSVTGGSPSDSAAPVEPGAPLAEVATPLVERESLGVEIPAPPVVLVEPVTVKSLWQDAAVDLVGSFCCMGLIAFAIYIGVRISQGAQVAGEMSTSGWGIASLLVVQNASLLYFAWRRRRRNREKQHPVIGFFDGETGAAISKGIAAGFAMITLSVLYSAAVQRLFGKDALDNRLDFLQNLLDNRIAVIGLVFIIAVVAPFCEEIFFRGAIFGSAHAAGFNVTGAIISAMLFALVHLSLLLAPFYATFALTMCWLYARTGTLAAPIAAHMTLNGVACAALVIAGNGSV